VVYEETGTGRRLEGPDVYIAALEAWKRAIPDVRGTIRHSTASGDTAVFELMWEGTHTGALDSPGGTIPASGKRVHVPAALASTVQGDKVREVRHYLDVLSLLQQIGAIPAPGQTASA
jgi:predicted ester cyclase